jgi:hypothetical protein
MDFAVKIHSKGKFNTFFPHHNTNEVLVMFCVPVSDPIKLFFVR